MRRWRRRFVRWLEGLLDDEQDPGRLAFYISVLKTEIAFFRKRRAEWKRVDTYDEQQAGERLYA